MLPVLPDQIHARARRIAERAYELFEARGGADGCDLDDWLQAEREILAAEQPGLAEVALDLEPPVTPAAPDLAVLAEKPASPDIAVARR